MQAHPFFCLFIYFHSAKCAYCIHVSRGIYDVDLAILLSSLLFIHISIQPSVLIFTCDDVPRALIQQEKIPTADLKNLNHIVFFIYFFCGMIT